MTIQDLGSIGELLAAIATVATLGYLALQVRRSNESDRLNAELGLSAHVANFHARMTSQPDLLRVWDDAAEDSSSLSPEDKRKYRWIVAELFFIYEGHYQMYRKGHISSESWQAKRDSLSALLQDPVIEEWWEKRMAPLNLEFREYVESLRTGAGGSWSHQNVAIAGHDAPPVSQVDQ